MTCMKQEFCIHEKYCQRHIGQNFDSCILFSRNSKPMNNEEWFCSLSTEEKARVLVNNKLFFRMLDYDGFIEWLKEKHE